MWSRKNQKFSLSALRIFLLFIFILIVVLFLIAGIMRSEKAYSQNSQKTFTESIIHFTSLPFQFVQEVFSGLEKFRLDKQTCEYLADENKILNNEIIRLKEENEKLTSVLSYHSDIIKNIATARIITSPTGLFSRVFRVGVGKKAGVKIGDTVINAQGLVGKIIKTSDYSSEILPIHHVSSKVVGVVQDNDIKILIGGRNQKYAVAEYISDPLSLKDNMMIVTMSNGGNIPPDIPIGRLVSSVEKPVKIKLAVNFAKLNMVRIIRPVHAQNYSDENDISVSDIQEEE